MYIKYFMKNFFWKTENINLRSIFSLNKYFFFAIIVLLILAQHFLILKNSKMNTGDQRSINCFKLCYLLLFYYVFITPTLKIKTLLF